MRNTAKSLLFVGGLTTWAPFADGKEHPENGAARLEGIGHGGDGCPRNTVGSYISEDNQVFTLSFDKFSVQQGPNVPPTERRKFCNITVNLKIPDGWQFAIGEVEYRGYANLDAKMRGEIRASYRYDGVGGSLRPLRAQFTGPVTKDYLQSDVLTSETRGWSRCGRKHRGLEIKTEIEISGDNKAAGLLTVDTIDGKARQIYGIAWRKCTEDGK